MEKRYSTPIEDILKGDLHKDKYGYQIRFWNPVTKTQEYIGYDTELEDAYKLYCKRQVEFYKQYNYLMPVHITLDTSKNIFRFQINHTDKYGKRKTFHIYSGKSLTEVLFYKKQFISNLY